ncbi:LapA family protein [Saccharopolyspora sp. WRP15-2]|uniref:LapA family protein n=1 Tax=Saccharopolyspora oryzae TaxID=2997343 RepID=A0ABT4V988_9PSEU|nr:LapA family protein [Saccharopolyspora oryzae]MDA3630503.1 LapA family protein [Saccharopolyspora oryzae]
MKRRGTTVEPTGRRWGPAATALVLVALGVVLAVENRALVEIRLLVPVVTLPLWTALAVLLVIGVVIGLLVGRSRK